MGTEMNFLSQQTSLCDNTMPIIELYLKTFTWKRKKILILHASVKTIHSNLEGLIKIQSFSLGKNMEKGQEECSFLLDRAFVPQCCTKISDSFSVHVLKLSSPLPAPKWEHSALFAN